MPTVETVRGPIDTADMGPTLVHEHVFVLSTEHVQDYGDCATRTSAWPTPVGHWL